MSTFDLAPLLLLGGAVLLAVVLSRWLGWLLASGIAVLAMSLGAVAAGGAPSPILLIVGVLLCIGGAIVRAIERSRS